MQQWHNPTIAHSVEVKNVKLQPTIMASIGGVFQLTSLPALSDEVVICFSSIVVLTPNVQFLFVAPLLHSASDMNFSVSQTFGILTGRSLGFGVDGRKF